MIESILAGNGILSDLNFAMLKVCFFCIDHTLFSEAVRIELFVGFLLVLSNLVWLDNGRIGTVVVLHNYL